MKRAGDDGRPGIDMQLCHIQTPKPKSTSRARER